MKHVIVVLLALFLSSGPELLAAHQDADNDNQNEPLYLAYDLLFFGYLFLFHLPSGTDASIASADSADIATIYANHLSN